MQSVLLTIHLLACIALVIAVMLQRSEGGALGMGGGGTGGLISGRGAAGVLVRTTMGLAAIFFVTSTVMTRLNNESANAPSILEQPVSQPGAPSTTAPTTPGQVDPLGGATTTPPASTTAPAPAAPVPTAPDPLAPSSSAPAPAATQPAPATTAPTTPSPTPENGGSPN